MKKVNLYPISCHSYKNKLFFFVDLLEAYLYHLPGCVLLNALSKENEHQISL